MRAAIYVVDASSLATSSAPEGGGERGREQARPALVGAERLLALHARAERGALAAADLDEYRSLREAFFAAMVELQNAALGGGQIRRAAARVRRAVKVELSGPALHASGLTLDVGTGGFAALLPEPLARETAAVARLLLPARQELEARVVVVGARRRQRAAHVSFAFTERTGDWTLLEDLVLGDLLASCPVRKAVAPSEPTASWAREAGRAEVVAAMTGEQLPAH